MTSRLGLCSVDGRGECTGRVRVRRMLEVRNLAVDDEAAEKAGLPIRDVRAALLPLHECRLVAPIVEARHRSQMGFRTDKDLNRAAFLPGGGHPIQVVRV